MSDASIVLAQPTGSNQLVLLFHGVGASADDLAPLGEAIAQAIPQATVASVNAPHPSSLGRGREWFSVLGVTEQNRPERIAQAMPDFLGTVAQWQQHSGVGPSGTTLVGFSQGSIMALEATQAQPTAFPASCVIAVAGRLAEPARHAPTGCQLHLIHGEQDAVVPTRCSVEAAQVLNTLGAQVSLDLLPGLGHGIDQRALRLILG